MNRVIAPFKAATTLCLSRLSTLGINNTTHKFVLQQNTSAIYNVPVASIVHKLSVILIPGVDLVVQGPGLRGKVLGSKSCYLSPLDSVTKKKKKPIWIRNLSDASRPVRLVSHDYAKLPLCVRVSEGLFKPFPS